MMTELKTKTEITVTRDELAMVAADLAPKGVSITAPSDGELSYAVVATGTDGRELMLWWDDQAGVANAGWAWASRRWDDESCYYTDHSTGSLDSRREFADLLWDLVS
jgi:hypothetical protein